MLEARGIENPLSDTDSWYSLPSGRASSHRQSAKSMRCVSDEYLWGSRLVCQGQLGLWTGQPLSVADGIITVAHTGIQLFVSLAHFQRRGRRMQCMEVSTQPNDGQVCLQPTHIVTKDPYNGARWIVIRALTEIVLRLTSNVYV